MKWTNLTIFLLFLLFTASCSTDKSSNIEHSPYVNQADRKIKALSAEKVAGYLKGRGMGFSKVAELNHYPGPKHVLDLSDRLRLNEEQHQQVILAFQTMQSTAQKLGRRIVDKERRLDKLFAGGNAAKPSVKVLIEEIGRLKAELRFAHVQAHVKMKKVLTPAQVKQYDKLRGYEKGQTGQMQHNHQKHGA